MKIKKWKVEVFGQKLSNNTIKQPITFKHIKEEKNFTSLVCFKSQMKTDQTLITDIQLPV